MADTFQSLSCTSGRIYGWCKRFSRTVMLERWKIRDLLFEEEENECEKDVLILAIESSCDETAASVVKNGRTICLI